MKYEHAARQIMDDLAAPYVDDPKTRVLRGAGLEHIVAGILMKAGYQVYKAANFHDDADLVLVHKKGHGQPLRIEVRGWNGGPEYRVEPKDFDPDTGECYIDLYIFCHPVTFAIDILSFDDPRIQVRLDERKRRKGVK